MYHPCEEGDTAVVEQGCVVGSGRGDVAVVEEVLMERIPRQFVLPNEILLMTCTYDVRTKQS